MFYNLISLSAEVQRGAIQCANNKYLSHVQVFIILKSCTPVSTCDLALFNLQALRPDHLKWFKEVI